MHIAIAGNIGSGKTTLTNMLAKRYNWTPRFEPVDNNPYLEDFYANMKRWAFNLQIFFLSKRFAEVVEISKSDEKIIQDRTIFEDACIFAPNLHAQGMMSDRDFDNYSELFKLMMSLVKLPDLMIYIRSSIPTLVSHIQKRGRDYEKSIRIDYLEGLNQRYENWIKDYKGNLIIVDGDNLDFENSQKDFQQIADQIDSNLFGLFPATDAK
ncbi:MAG: deoxynucleoside kinase [Prevotella sp.]|jgi:deoxyadenosine/deoxycytidine kinase|nr:deoxynucleoside kinase [Prevotella sp.]